MEYIFFVGVPLLLLAVSITALIRSVRRRKPGFIFGYSLCSAGVLIHLIGLMIIGGFEGMAVSLIGACVLALGMLVLLVLAVRLFWKKKNSDLKLTNL